MSRVLWWIAGVAGVCAVLLALAYAGSRSLIFFPDRTDPGAIAGQDLGTVTGEDITITTSDELELSAYLVRPNAEADRETAVLYLPGNGGNRAGRVDVGRELAEQGFTVLLLDYRGYGGNDGSPSEEGLILDAQAAAAYVRSVGFEPERTIYVGESIGTGVTSWLTVSDPPAGVVLRSPFTSLADVGAGSFPRPLVELVLRDRFESAEHLAGTQVPILVLAGDADTIVPARLSRELAAAIGDSVELEVLPGVGHNDAVWFGPFLAERVAAVADEVVPEGR